MIARSFFHFFERDRLPAAPWKNGGGSTCEIACWPPGAGIHDFDWRLSIASIEQAGPFSVFEGVDRHIMLLDGDGVRLRSGDDHIDHRLDAPYRPFAFSGDAGIDCTLLGGPSSDFNVMTRRDRCRAELQIIDKAASVPPCRHGLLFALLGGWTLAPAETIAQGQGQGVWWGDAPQGWELSPVVPDALLLTVRIVEP